jgi:hypothetical protein
MIDAKLMCSGKLCQCIQVAHATADRTPTETLSAANGGNTGGYRLLFYLSHPTFVFQVVSQHTVFVFFQRPHSLRIVCFQVPLHQRASIPTGLEVALKDAEKCCQEKKNHGHNAIVS